MRSCSTCADARQHNLAGDPAAVPRSSGCAALDRLRSVRSYHNASIAQQLEQSIRINPASAAHPHAARRGAGGIGVRSR